MGVFFKNNAWWIDYRDHKGKRHRQKVGPKKKAEETLIRIRSKILSGEFVDPAEEKRREKQNSLFRNYAGEYLEWSKANKARKSYERDITSIKAHLLDAFGDLRLNEITRKMLEDYKTRRKNKDGANVATVNREVTCMKSMLRKAHEWGYRGCRPAGLLRWALYGHRRDSRIVKLKAVKASSRAPSGYTVRCGPGGSRPRGDRRLLRDRSRPPEAVDA